MKVWRILLLWLVKNHPQNNQQQGRRVEKAPQREEIYIFPRRNAENLHARARSGHPAHLIGDGEKQKLDRPADKTSKKIARTKSCARK